MNNTAAGQMAKPGSMDHELVTIAPVPYVNSGAMSGRALAFLLLLASSPIIATLIILVRLTSRGPGMYRQVRVGKDGRIFVMYKIRSMVEDAEDNTGPVWTQDHEDPRITTIGKLIRKSHLDELPQLMNVARGEMSLFGPRPERPELVHILGERIPGYFNRLAVRPGITGLAQINLPPDSDLESVRRKLVLDLEYIRTANPLLDLRMFCWTGLRLVGVSATRATKWMGLNRKVQPVASKCAPVSIIELLQNPFSDTESDDDDSCDHGSSSFQGESLGMAMRSTPEV